MLDHVGQRTTPKYAALMAYLGSPIPLYIPPPQAPIEPVVTINMPDTPPPTPVMSKTLQQSLEADIATMMGGKIVTEVRPKQITLPKGTLQGDAVADWLFETDKATSPPILLQGKNNKLTLTWNFQAITNATTAFFRIYAIDHKGGRKLLLSQTHRDISEVSNYEQVFIENLDRYVGAPIQLMLQAHGLQAVVHEVKF